MSTLARVLRQRGEPLVERWLAKVEATLRSEQPLDRDELRDSLHFFLDELTEALEKGRTLGETGDAIAQAHGAQRQVLQRDVADLVREYGLLFEAIVDECEEAQLAPLSAREYALLATCLNGGASEAVREFAKLRDLDLTRQAWEHFAFLAHEIRNPLQTARLAATLLRSGAGERGISVLDRSLAQLAEMIDRALMDARLRGLDAGAALHLEAVDLRKLIQGSVDDARPDADAREIRLEVQVAAPVRLNADARVLRSALINLVRNAVKFTRTRGTVIVRGAPGRIEVEDECGGLRPGDEEQIFASFRQAGEDRSGFGLGLAIAQQAVEAHGGTVRVRNLPGKGCVFVVDLPT